jgi:hypothetical protein
MHTPNPTQPRGKVNSPIPTIIPLIIQTKQITPPNQTKQTTTGVSDVTGVWTLNQTSCTNNTSSYVVSGTVGLAMTWVSPVSVNMQFNINGFLGVSWSFNVVATINGLVANVPGTYTITTNNGINGTLSALNFAGCTMGSSSVDVTVAGVDVSQIDSTLQSKLSAEGTNICNNLNNNLVPLLVGTSVPLVG